MMTMHAPFIPQITLYRQWLARERGLAFDSYDALWRWSTTDLDAFWQSVWDYFELQSPTPHTQVCDGAAMPYTRWFTGAQVNYARQVMRHVTPAAAAGLPAIISHNEDSLGHRAAAELTWPQLKQQVAALALHLRAQGVQPGDRVAAYLPNIPEAMVAFLATVSIGGVWSICAPDMGTQAVLDRFKQIEPRVLIACDGVRYGGRALDRSGVVAELLAALPTVQHVLVHRSGLEIAAKTIANYLDLARVTARNDAEVSQFEPLWLPFDHPLWIVYSRGTTGLPKPIVHGHGGTVIVALALKVLHNDVGSSYAANSSGERYHWYSSTGWVMWNAQMSGLLNGTTCCIYDGNPAGRTVDEAGNKLAPDWGTLWRFGADVGATFFGAGAAFFANCQKAGLDLSTCGELRQVRALGTTGSPLSIDAQNWGTHQFRNLHAAPPTSKLPPSLSPFPSSPSSFPRKRESTPPWIPASAGMTEEGRAAHDMASVAVASAMTQFSAGPSQGKLAPPGGSAAHEVASVGAISPDIWWCNISGGTDFAGAFIGGNRELPQVPGEMQCRLLGCAVEAWNEQGEPVVGEVGELVCRQPIPSMPLYFWGDAGHQRYLSSYFDLYPGVWRHGDWLKVGPNGGCIIYGRSDATINRHGLRMGTSELYSAVEALPEVLDSMVVDLEYLGRDSYMPLFVVLREGLSLDATLQQRLVDAIKTALSPRFVPNEIFQVAEIPRTLSGKKQELPIKKLLLGQPLAKVVNREAMANPGCLDWYVALAARRAGSR